RNGSAPGARLSVVVHDPDAGVGQPGRGPCLVTHTLPEVRIGGVATGEHLDRDLAAEHLVEGAPDNRHPSGAQPLHQPVPLVHPGHDLRVPGGRPFYPRSGITIADLTTALAWP